ncbi:hypothetical protein SAY87_030533 [Trapa incisa]|uniref:Uncharacterized protein n=1 Tax=Trapa incisa TaxID=236973 RepID=A0AAN7KVD8_9MYRT|nr:hypothetical protein SAY87_030533 [Trapa incisa]
MDFQKKSTISKHKKQDNRVISSLGLNETLKQLLDWISNLAGLARTCEVFKTFGLTISDVNIIRHKQFQLIRFSQLSLVAAIFLL